MSQVQLNVMTGMFGLSYYLLLSPSLIAAI